MEKKSSRPSEGTNLLGIIGGTSLLQSTRFVGNLQKHIEVTPFGEVVLHFGSGFVFCQRHQADPNISYSPPHLINSKSIIFGLKQVGVTRIIAFGSVGSLHQSIEVGTVVIPDDFFNMFTAPLAQTAYDDARGHIVPKINEALRNEVISVIKNNSQVHLQKLKLKTDRGTYVQTIGPRLETKAEIRVLATFGEVVGMTSATEIVLACEQQIPIALVTMVDNYANGISQVPLSMDEFHISVKQNESTVEQILGWLLDNFASTVQ